MLSAFAIKIWLWNLKTEWEGFFITTFTWKNKMYHLVLLALSCEVPFFSHRWYYFPQNKSLLAIMIPINTTLSTPISIESTINYQTMLSLNQWKILIQIDPYLASEIQYDVVYLLKTHQTFFMVRFINALSASASTVSIWLDGLYLFSRASMILWAIPTSYLWLLAESSAYSYCSVFQLYSYDDLQYYFITIILRLR